MRARLAILLAGSVALGGCAYGYGGYGSPYSSFSVGVGYGSGYGGYGGYGYSPYCGYGGYGAYGLGYGGGYGGYDRYGFPYGGSGYGNCGYGSPYFGWYNNYYYPGSGYYVYDRYRRPHVWSDSQKQYWTERRNRVLSDGKVKEQALRENWTGFDRTNRQTVDRSARRAERQERVRGQRDERQVKREERKVERTTSRTTRSADRTERRRGRGSDDTQPQ